MTCANGSGKPRKHYMMGLLIEMLKILLFNKIFKRQYFGKDRSAQIDINAISFTGPGNTPETVIDYIDRILTSPTCLPEDLHRIRRIRNNLRGQTLT